VNSRNLTGLTSAQGRAPKWSTTEVRGVEILQMEVPGFVECSFLIPIVRDANLSDGELHSTTAWELLTDELWDRFGGATIAPGFYEGFYRDPDTGDRVSDKSRKYIVALTEDQIPELKRFLSDICSVFCQKCIYFNISGRVEFVSANSPPQQSS
jgi:hypothetical protein